MRRTLLALVAVASVVLAVSMRGALWIRHPRAPAVTAEDFRAKRVEWDLDSLAHGERMNALWFAEDGQSLWMGGEG